jgi:hypothetical protein
MELGQGLFLGSEPVQLIQNNNFASANVFEYSFLFDEFPDADFGISFRKLKSTYNGPCVKVRRASDNATSDIWFENFEIDTNALLSFAAGSSLAIDTWYDQSGNANNLTQPSTTRQPLIVSSGTLITGSVSNPKPSALFDGTNSLMTGSNFTSGDSAATIFNVYNTSAAAAVDSATMFVYMVGDNGGNNFFKGSSAGALTGEYMTFGVTKTGVAAGRLGSSTYRRNANTLVIEDEYWISTGTKFYQNTSEVTLNLTANSYTTSTDVSPSSVNTTANLFVLGAFANSGGTTYSVPHNGKISELVSWPQNKINERSNIQSQINSYYQVY